MQSPAILLGPFLVRDAGPEAFEDVVTMPVTLFFPLLYVLYPVPYCSLPPFESFYSAFCAIGAFFTLRISPPSIVSRIFQTTHKLVFFQCILSPE